VSLDYILDFQVVVFCFLEIVIHVALRIDHDSLTV
jgi:hypothetical protein